MYSSYLSLVHRRPIGILSSCNERNNWSPDVFDVPEDSQDVIPTASTLPARAVRCAPVPIFARAPNLRKKDILGEEAVFKAISEAVDEDLYW